MTLADWLVGQRRITSEHKAAHAGLLPRFGSAIHRIEIEPEALTLSTAEPTMRQVWHLAVISVAGIVIEGRHREHFEPDAEVDRSVPVDRVGRPPTTDRIAHSKRRARNRR